MQFLVVARGSLLELETHLIIAEELSYLKAESTGVLLAQVQRIGQMLNRLMVALRSHIK